MTTKPDPQTLALQLHQALAAVDITDIPILSRDRHLPRKEQARLARGLFKQLGLRGISVTVPNYSMATSVDVRLPRRTDYQLNTHGQVDDYAKDPAAVANQQAVQRIEAILLAAFPRHEDRSDSRTDYFDFKWSLS